MKAREAWFEQVRACRRRNRRDWRAAPVAKLFKIADEYELLQQQATRRLISACLRKLRMHP